MRNHILQVLNLCQKELLHLRRDRLMTPFILLGPTFLLVLMASATAADIAHLGVGIVDQDRSPASRSLIAAFDNHPQLATPRLVDSAAQATALLDGDDIDMVVTIPPRFGADLASPARQPAVQVLIDGSNVLVGGTLRAAAEGLLGRFAVDQLRAQGVPVDAERAQIDVRPLVYYNENLNERYYSLPAMLALIAYIVTMLTASVGISREREHGTMEQLAVTPISRLELMLGKAAPVMIVAMLDFVVMLVVITIFLGVPMRGSVPLLLVLTALYVQAEMGIGLVLSSIVRSQQQSLLMVFLLGVMNVAFSGYLVPVDNMPWLLNRLSYAFPLRHYTGIVRDIMLKNSTLPDLQVPVLALLLLGAGIAIVTYRVIESRLD